MPYNTINWVALEIIPQRIQISQNYLQQNIIYASCAHKVSPFDRQTSVKKQARKLQLSLLDCYIPATYSHIYYQLANKLLKITGTHLLQYYPKNSFLLLQKWAWLNSKFWEPIYYSVIPFFCPLDSGYTKFSFKHSTCTWTKFESACVYHFLSVFIVRSTNLLSPHTSHQNTQQLSTRASRASRPLSLRGLQLQPSIKAKTASCGNYLRNQ